jgi:hypothetical protein
MNYVGRNLQDVAVVEEDVKAFTQSGEEPLVNLVKSVRRERRRSKGKKGKKTVAKGGNPRRSQSNKRRRKEARAERKAKNKGKKRIKPSSKTKKRRADMRERRRNERIAEAGIKVPNGGLLPVPQLGIVHPSNVLRELNLPIVGHVKVQRMVLSSTRFEQ